MVGMSVLGFLFFFCIGVSQTYVRYHVQETCGLYTTAMMTREGGRYANTYNELIHLSQFELIQRINGL